MATNQSSIQQIISQEFSISGLINTLWQGRWLVLILVFLFTIGAVALSLTLPQIYTAQVTMMPQSESSNVGFLGKIASMTGTPIGESRSYENLYQEILRSDRILNSLLVRRWNSLPLSAEVSLYDIFELTEPTGDDHQSRLAEFRMKEMLRYKIISFQRNKINGYMKLKVSIPEDPPLAAEMANFLVDRLDEHNRKFRVGKAVEQKEFIQARLIQVEGELSEAESNLSVFLSRNKSYLSSPPLVQQYGELKRQALALTSIWSELRRQLELAQIDEHKESTSVDILDRASIPVRRSEPDRRAIVISGAFLGFMLGSLIVLIRHQRALSN